VKKTKIKSTYSVPCKQLGGISEIAPHKYLEHEVPDRVQTLALDEIKTTTLEECSRLLWKKRSEINLL
jgi:hypothetical protein